MKGYFFDTDFLVDAEKGMNASVKYYILVIYDITDNKRRNRLAKLLKSFGFRVQKSAFEARLEDKKYTKLLAQLSSFAKEGDSVRVYKVQGKGAITVFGEDSSVEEEDFIII